MLHLPYTLMVLAFVVVGACIAPRISWLLLGGTLLAYFFGLGIGAHLLDQIPGMGSRYVRRWPARALWFGGFLSLAVAVALGVIAAVWFVGPLLLLFVAVQGICAVGYPLASWFGGWLHRDAVFAVSWGSLPFLTSFFAQTGQVTAPALLLAAGFGAIAVVEIHLSRASRRLRSTATVRESRPMAAGSTPRPTFRRFDRALQLLSSATVIVAFGLLVSRMTAGA